MFGHTPEVVRDGEVVMSGPLLKAPKQRPKENHMYTLGSRSSLRQRWFTLTDNGHFDYYVDDTLKSHKGTVSLLAHLIALS